MSRVVFISSASNFDRRYVRLAKYVAGLAYFGAIYAAAATGWSRGGLPWALVYGVVAVVLAPFILVMGVLALGTLVAVLTIPGSYVATQFGWTRFSPYVGRRRWLQATSVIVILTPLLIYQPRQVWELVALLGGVFTLGLLILAIMVIVLSFFLMRHFLSAVTQNNPDSGTDVEPSFRWTKLDPPRLPPPGDE
jgi:hypothetical protein